jgi:hypothetical protein
MKVIGLWLCFVILLISAHRLLAPISEIPQTTPTPTPKREAPPKTKASPALRFAGTWTGKVKVNNGPITSDSYTFVISISDDEKTVSINEGTPASCSRFRETLTWSLSNSSGTNTYTMRINSNGTASFVKEQRITSGDYAGVTSGETGTFSRQ